MRTTWSMRAIAGSVVLCVAAISAHGDAEETERRLKSAGVDDALRARIHAAITKGAKHVRGRQSKDGAFRNPGSSAGDAHYDVGITGLCALALAHAGSRESTESARRAVEFLCPPGKDARLYATTYVYSAGILAMLLQSMHERRDVAQRIADEMAHRIDPATSWWGYGETSSGQIDIVNLSTTQFAALGLWAGARNGARVEPGTWRRHLAALCAYQSPDGSWPYGPPRQIPPSAGYATGTFMGCANLVLARGALAGVLEDDPELCARSEIALARARRGLDADGAAAVTFPPRNRVVDYYQLYALEKACTFADTERVGDARWYVAGAERLLDVQLADGSWGNGRTASGMGLMAASRPEGDLVSTSFALLFLLRVSETFHPTTPRDVVAPGPTTPGGENGPVAAPHAPAAAPPPPRAVSMSRAEQALDRVEAWLHAQKSDDTDALAALEEVAAALRHLEPDPVAETATPGAQLAREREFMTASKAWREHAGTVLVDAVQSRSDDVAVRAALALSAGPRSASIPLRSVIDHRLRSGHDDEAPRPLVDAAFGALADLGHEDLLPWLATRVADAREILDVRATRAALGALAHFDGGEPAARLAAARRIVRAMSGIAGRAAAAKLDDVAGRADFVHWRTLEPNAIAALRALCADDAAEPPRGPDGTPLSTMTEFAAYLDVKRPK